MLRLNASSANDGALQVRAVGVVEGTTAGNESQGLLGGAADDLLQRRVVGVVLTDPLHLVGVDLAVRPGDGDLVPLDELTDGVEDGGSDVLVVDVTGHHLVARLA